MRKKIQTLAVIGILLAAMVTAKTALAGYVEEVAKWTMPIYDEIYLCMDVEDIVMEETSEGLRLFPKEGLSTTKLENLQKDIAKLDVVSFTKAELPKGENTFLLYTSIYEEVLQENGQYLYTAVTNGVWGKMGCQAVRIIRQQGMIL